MASGIIDNPYKIQTGTITPNYSYILSENFEYKLVKQGRVVTLNVKMKPTVNIPINTSVMTLPTTFCPTGRVVTLFGFNHAYAASGAKLQPFAYQGYDFIAVIDTPINANDTVFITGTWILD